MCWAGNHTEMAHIEYAGVKVELQAGERTQILQPAQLIWLKPNTPYAMRALSDASLLMTIVRRQALGASNT